MSGDFQIGCVTLQNTLIKSLNEKYWGRVTNLNNQKNIIKIRFKCSFRLMT